MYQPSQLTTTSRPVRNSTGQRHLPSRFFVILLSFAAAWFALAPTAPGVNPPPEGGYPGENTALGFEALFSLTTMGLRNTAIGFQALHLDTSGGTNTGLGAYTLYYNSTGFDNTASGSFALFYNSTGDSNTATGVSALAFNTTGNYNTATGALAMHGSSAGSFNTATGAQTLINNTGDYNTASGSLALANNSGSLNTSTGYRALYGNETGNSNTANGGNTLFRNTTGHYNTAAGVNALYENTTGSQNTAIGLGALNRNTTGSFNTAEGVNALYYNTTGSSNIALGVSAGADLTTGGYNINIGNRGVANENGHIRIGTKTKQTNTYIAGISGVTIPAGVGVIVDTNGHLGTIVSSKRFKDKIEPMNEASASVLALKPVTFRYKNELDPKGIAQFGLVAEEVEKVNPDLVARDEAGKAYTVRYEAVNAMLLNEFLKEHRKVEKMESTIAQQQKQIAALAESIERLLNPVPRVSDINNR